MKNKRHPSYDLVPETYGEWKIIKKCCDRDYKHKHLNDGGVDITESPIAQEFKKFLDELE